MIKTLPIFPDFRPFTTDDISWYYNYYIDQGLNPYADINHENLLVWLNMNRDLLICRIDKTLILRYTNVLNKNQINIIPLSRSLNDSVVKKIMAYLKNNKLPLMLCEIPSNICDDLDKNMWQIEEDRDSNEYILSVNQQILLEGSTFRRQRNRISRFERKYKNDSVTIKFYKKFNNEIKKAFINHINTMPFNHSYELSKKNILEPIAIRKNLDYAMMFHKKALSIKINNKIVSLAMISYLDKKTASVNHLKVDYSIWEIFHYSIYRIAIALNNEGITEINFEQDLGIDGLRKHKELLHPSRFLEKKTIRPRRL